MQDDLAKQDKMWRTFPVHLLPDGMRWLATEIARALYLDPSVPVLPMLSLAGAAIGNSVVLQMRPDYLAHPLVWTGVVMRSGEKKSPVLKAVAKPFYDLQQAAQLQQSEEMQQFLEARKAWLSKKPADRGEEPAEPPALKHFFLNQATIEAVTARLQTTPRGLPLILDELSGLTKGMNQYSSKGGNDLETYLSFYDAAPTKIDRKNALPATIFIPRAFVAITGTIQPEVLAELLGPAEFNSGFGARILFAAPPPQLAFWTKEGPDGEATECWSRVIHGLLAIPLSHRPLIFHPEPAAMDMFEEAHNRLERCRHEEPDNRMRAARAKLTGTIPRLALIFELVERATNGTDLRDCLVREENMHRAIELVDWFVHETGRLYGLLDEIGSDEAIIKRIQENSGRVTARQLMRWSRSKFPTLSHAARFLQALADDGQGQYKFAKQDGAGRPSRVFRLNEAAPVT